MQRCSYFIPNKALFGSYPSRLKRGETAVKYNEIVQELEENGVRYFIDLTYKGEEFISHYETKYTYINYPIGDQKPPVNWTTFASLIIKICDIINRLNPDEKIYIHCRGGHGRSGVVVACILCYYFSISPKEALELTTKYHSNRREMSDKWRRIGSPQTIGQKDFVYKFNSPVFMNHISIPCSLKRYDNDKRSIYILNEWVKLFPTVRGKLLQTGLRPLIEVSPDSYWGDGCDGTGRNTLGKLLSYIRDYNLYPHINF